MEILMKKFGLLLTAVAMLSANAAHAQSGNGANAGKNAATNDFAWGIALGGLAVVAVVVGVVAASASSSPSTFSH